MLQLSGQNLIGDNTDSEAEDFIRRFIPTESYMPWLTPFYPGWNLAAITSTNGYQWGQKFNLNKFRWPSGASRFAYGHYLCNSDTVASISSNAYGNSGQYNQILFQIGNPEDNSASGQTTIVAGETFSSMVYMLPPTPLSGIRGLTGMTQSLYLITIVDERYFWWWQNFGNQTISSSTTWASLIGIITSILGVTINLDVISASYLAPSVQAYSLPFEPIPLILDSICMNLGWRFVANGSPSPGGSPNTYSTQLYGTALSAFNNDMSDNPGRLVTAGGQRFANPL
jgi:hypothetical protein